MNSTTLKKENDKTHYSKILSSLFCSISIIMLSILCLLNNFSIDIYSTVNMLKIIIPASFSFWFIGYIIGKILDRFTDKIVYKKITNEQKAYEIPSIFSDASLESDDETLL